MPHFFLFFFILLDLADKSFTNNHNILYLLYSVLSVLVKKMYKNIYICTKTRIYVEVLSKRVHIIYIIHRWYMAAVLSYLIHMVTFFLSHVLHPFYLQIFSYTYKMYIWNTSHFGDQHDLESDYLFHLKGFTSANSKSMHHGVGVWQNKFFFFFCFFKNVWICVK